MFRLLFLLVGATGLVSSSLEELVNMYVGTSYSFNISDVHDYGNTMVSVGAPFAHTTWTPQTRVNENKCTSPYYYFDSRWRGLRRTHWMSGSCVIDYGASAILPSITLDLQRAVDFHALNHEQESAIPSQYKMHLSESNLTLEATSANAAGILLVEPGTAPSGAKQGDEHHHAALRAQLDDHADTKQQEDDDHYYLFVLPLDSMYNQSSVRLIPSADHTPSSQDGLQDSRFSVSVDSPVHRWYQAKGEWAGFSGHHVYEFSQVPSVYGVIHGYTGGASPGATSGNSSSAGPAVAYMRFSRNAGPLTVTTGCSFINSERAHENIYHEITDLWTARQQQVSSHIPASSQQLADGSPSSAKSSEGKDSVEDHSAEASGVIERSSEQKDPWNSPKVLRDNTTSERSFDISHNHLQQQQLRNLAGTSNALPLTGRPLLQLVAANVSSLWEERLSAIRVSNLPLSGSGAKEETSSTHLDAFSTRREGDLVTFYSALWHTLLVPRQINDWDGAYLSFDTPREVEYTSAAAQKRAAERGAHIETVAAQSDVRKNGKVEEHGVAQDATAADGSHSISTMEASSSASASATTGSMDTSRRSNIDFGRYFDDYSMWDIFRAQVPLLNLVYTDVVRDLIASLLMKTKQGGWLPIFPAWNSYTDEMIGDHCGVLIADAVLKGVLPVDDPLVLPIWRAVVRNALVSPSTAEVYKQGKGRRALWSYEKYGYIPLEDLVLQSPHPLQQVSRTLEYAYDDFVAARFTEFIKKSHLDAHARMAAAAAVATEREAIHNESSADSSSSSSSSPSSSSSSSTSSSSLAASSSSILMSMSVAPSSASDRATSSARRVDGCGDDFHHKYYFHALSPVEHAHRQEIVEEVEEVEAQMLAQKTLEDEKQISSVPVQENDQHDWLRGHKHPKNKLQRMLEALKERVLTRVAGKGRGRFYREENGEIVVRLANVTSGDKEEFVGGEAEGALRSAWLEDGINIIQYFENRKAAAVVLAEEDEEEEVILSEAQEGGGSESQSERQAESQGESASLCPDCWRSAPSTSAPPETQPVAAPAAPSPPPQIQLDREQILRADREQKFIAMLDKTLAKLYPRSKNYRNLIDADGVGFVRPKHVNGKWGVNATEFNPANYYKWITETNVWQYTWFVPHDVEEMIEIYGGEEKFSMKLDQFFDEKWYNHGNEPDHHAVFLYAYLPQSSWKLSQRVSKIIDEHYGPTERSLSGNEDAGQMSAWMVLSSIGLYQVCPGCGGFNEYVLTIPRFDRITLQLPPTFAAPPPYSSFSSSSFSTYSTDSHRGAAGSDTEREGADSSGGSSSDSTMHENMSNIPAEEVNCMHSAETSRVGGSRGTHISDTRAVQTPGKMLQIEVLGREDIHTFSSPATANLSQQEPRAEYLEKVLINGVDYRCNFVSHWQVQQGGIWQFFVSATPNKLRSPAASHRDCLKNYPARP